MLKGLRSIWEGEPPNCVIMLVNITTGGMDHRQSPKVRCFEIAKTIKTALTSIGHNVPVNET